jgi:hypothetical protein
VLVALQYVVVIVRPLAARAGFGGAFEDQQSTLTLLSQLTLRIRLAQRKPAATGSNT